jgi:pimeloyl-ACP methyl ester carboxylesterase
MRQYLIFSGLGLVLLGCATPTARVASPASRPATMSDRKFTYVIVHGVWAGGWAFKEVDKLLIADGHKVYRPTLTGQGERAHLAGPHLLGTNIDLTTHITDIVNVILWEDLHDVVLVGHSYGGMVITGVADRVPERIKHVIYLDAFLPENGESLNGTRDSSRPGAAFYTTTNGFAFLRGYDPNKPPPTEVPHPANTFSEPISLKNQDAARKIPTTYILTVDKGREPQQDAFFRFYERAKSRGWTMKIMEGDHNVMWSHPKELVKLLEKAP